MGNPIEQSRFIPEDKRRFLGNPEVAKISFNITLTDLGAISAEERTGYLQRALGVLEDSESGTKVAIGILSELKKPQVLAGFMQDNRVREGMNVNAEGFRIALTHEVSSFLALPSDQQQEYVEGLSKPRVNKG